MILILFFAAVIISAIAVTICKHASLLTHAVKGDGLLSIASSKGYIYATTYQRWQLIANIVVFIAICVWIAFIISIISMIKHRNKESDSSEESENIRNL